MSEEKLSDVQRHVLELLHIVIDLFNSENIRYFMVGGTMLGAVRHKGFIPWDDDVDIGIPREDYERLLRVCAGKLPPHCALRTYQDETDHHYYYARIVDTRYHIRRLGSIRERDEELWIDLFPLDGMPKGALATLWHKAELQVTRLLYSMSTFDKINVKRPGRPLLDRMIIRFLLVTHMGANWNSRKLLDRLDKVLKKYPYQGSGYCLNFMGSLNGFSENLPMEAFSDGAVYDFEDLRLVGPADYDAYLRSLYGDYMQLPPESERNVHAAQFVEAGE